MMGLTSNIISLGGITIAIGAMVEASIVVIEQVHKKLQHWEETGRPVGHNPSKTIAALSERIADILITEGR